MINYYEELSPEEQLKVTQSVQLLYKQTFLLERKYDKRTGRFTGNRDFYMCNRHSEFIREYFQVMGIEVMENSQLGMICVRDEAVVGGKLSKLAVLHLLILKLVYDEQVALVSSSVNVYTTLSNIRERLGSCWSFKKQPPTTDIRQAISLLKKYQIIEPLEMINKLEGHDRIIIYPYINVVLFRGDMQGLLKSYREEEDEDDSDETKIWGIIENSFE